MLFQVTLVPHPKTSANKVNAAEREGCCMQVGERVRLLTRDRGGWQHLAVFESHPRPKRNVSNGQLSSLQECKVVTDWAKSNVGRKMLKFGSF